MATRPKQEPTGEDLQRLARIARRVWQYIGSDMQECGELDNEMALEACFDADRPLLCDAGNPADDLAADNAFCKLMFKRYTFNNCVRAVSRVVHIA